MYTLNFITENELHYVNQSLTENLCLLLSFFNNVFPNTLVM